MELKNKFSDSELNDKELTAVNGGITPPPPTADLKPVEYNIETVTVRRSSSPNGKKETGNCIG